MLDWDAWALVTPFFDEPVNGSYLVHWLAMILKPALSGNGYGG